MDRDRPSGDDIEQRGSGGAECDRVLALIPAYSIGAADEDETAYVEAKLAECPEAATELAKYLRLAEALHYDAAPLTPPPAVLENIQAAIKMTAPVVLTPARKSGPQQANHRLEPSRFGRFWRPGLALSAGLFLLFLVSNIFWLTQVGQLRNSQEQLAAHAHDQDTALMLIGMGASNRIELPAVQSGLPEVPFAAIVGDPHDEYGLLYVKNFPALPSDKAYQLWLERDGEWTSPGVISVDEDGLGILVFHAVASLQTYGAIEITTEPAQGSPQPTSPPIVLRK